MILRLLLSVVMVCLFAGTAKAQFVIENAKVVLAVSGGERVDNSITIHNPGKEAADVRVYLEDFEYVEPFDGAKKFAAAGTLPGSPSQWVSFSPQEFKLPAFGKQKIDFTVTVPENIQGGHYGVLFFEKTDDIQSQMTGMRIVYRTGALLFIESKDRVKKGELEEVRVVDGNKLSANLLNQGDVVLVPRTTYYIMDASAYIIDRGEVAKLYVPPGAAAPLEVAVPASLKSGVYTFVFNADLEEGDVVVKEIDLVKDAAGSLSVTAVR